MQHTTSYRRLTNREREEISRGLAAGIPQAEIARRLKRHPSTISREVRNGSGSRGEYRAFSAGRRSLCAASSRRLGKSRLAREDRLRQYVRSGLTREWSPREIAERLKKEYPFDMTMRISHEAIYRYIYVLPRGELQRTLIILSPLAIYGAGKKQLLEQKTKLKELFDSALAKSMKN